MDPDESLRMLREVLVEHGQDAGESIDTAMDRFDRVHDLFEALDGWLSSGGHVPGAWSHPAPEPELPELPDGAEGCPFVYPDGKVCGSPLNLWDKEPVQRTLEWEEGKGWIAGPSKFADGGVGDEEVQCYELHEWALPEIEEWL